MSAPESEIPVQGALVLPEQRVALVRHGGEILALDLTCTHLGCTVRANAQGFACPCHGSRFTSRGEVLGGPAPRPLRRLVVERANGTVRVTRA